MCNCSANVWPLAVVDPNSASIKPAGRSSSVIGVASGTDWRTGLPFCVALFVNVVATGDAVTIAL